MKRTQLSLFVSGAEAARLERIRRVVDPVQAALIPAHVTLCREDELHGVEVELLARRVAAAAPIRLVFGQVERFSGHGILLRCLEGQPAFSALRRQILGISETRDSLAHLTLAHPRNPRAAGNSLEAVDLALPLSLVFDRAVLIEQLAAGEKWTVLSEFPFANAPRPGHSSEPARPALTAAPPCPTSHYRGFLN